MKRNPPKIPCAERIQLRRIKKVFIGIEDPDPTVSGKGIQYLKDHGISVEYFDRDLQKIIAESNSDFLFDAAMRAEIKKHEALVESLDSEGDPLEKIIPNATADQISSEAIKKFIEMGNAALKKRGKNPDLSEQNIWVHFERWGLVKTVGSRLMFTGNFVLLFFQSPNTFLNNSLFNARSNVSSSGAIGFDEPLVLLADKVLLWIKTNTPLNSFRITAVRTDVSSFGHSDEVILEAIINAMIHRDYSIPGAFNQVVILPDCIRIKSAGDPPAPQTIKDLSVFKASAITRNHKLAFVFRFIDQMDNNNVGMARFKSLPITEHLPFPLVEFKSPYLVTNFFQSFSAYSQAVQGRYDSSLSDQEIFVLEFLLVFGKTTMKEIKSVFQLHNEKASQRLLTGLVEKNLLLPQGSNKFRTYIRT